MQEREEAIGTKSVQSHYLMRACENVGKFIQTGLSDGGLLSWEAMNRMSWSVVLIYKEKYGMWEC